MNGDIAHTEALYLIDRHGYERSGYLYPFVPRFVAHDLRTLARDAGRSRGVPERQPQALPCRRPPGGRSRPALGRGCAAGATT